MLMLRTRKQKSLDYISILIFSIFSLHIGLLEPIYIIYQTYIVSFITMKHHLSFIIFSPKFSVPELKLEVKYDRSRNANEVDKQRHHSNVLNVKSLNCTLMHQVERHKHTQGHTHTHTHTHTNTRT